MSTPFIAGRRLSAALASAVLALPLAAVAAPAPGPGPIDLRAMRARADALRSMAREAVLPLAPGQTKLLEAVVMNSRGLVQWKADENGAWKKAEIDDILRPGAVIRTGGNSKLFLRVGHNVTLLVDRLSVVTLPEFIQDGDTLRTTIALERGIVDVKVDRVGPTNDIQVLTPSTTLAVQGTGFSIHYGELDGTQVAGARTNEMFAIELRFFLARFAYYLSGGATSSEGHPNPVISSLFETFGPPLMLTSLIEEGLDPELLDDSVERSAIAAERGTDYRDPPEPPVVPPVEMRLCPDDVYEVFKERDFGNAGDCGRLAEAICENLFAVFNAYDDRMVGSFGGQRRDGFDYEGLNALFVELDEICDDPDRNEQSLAEITRAVSTYCENKFHGRPADIDTCKTNFRRAARDVRILPRR